MKAVLLAPAVLAVLAVGPLPAIACDCISPAGDSAAIEEAIRSADLVATVRVTGFKIAERCEIYQSGERICRSATMAVVSIVDSMKGERSGAVLVDAMIDTSCNPGLEMGERVFLLAYRDLENEDQSGGARYVSSACSMDRQNNGAIPLEFSARRKKAPEE